jgi:hypothetical protein
MHTATDDHALSLSDFFILTAERRDYQHVNVIASAALT